MALDAPSENGVKTDSVHQINNKAFCFKAKTNEDAPRPWICKICSFPFKFKGNLLEHLRFYHLKGKVPCNHCEKTFPTSKQLRKHMREHSLARNQCPHCGSKLGTTTNTYDEHLKVCKRRPKNMFISAEVSQCTDTNKYTEDPLDPKLPQKRQKFDDCNEEFNKQCALCWLRFTDENTFQQHKCLPTVTSGSGVVITDTQKQQNVDRTTCNDLIDKHCATCKLKFTDKNTFHQHRCPSTMTTSCSTVVSYPNNSPSSVVQSDSNVVSFTPIQATPNFLPRTDIYNQQQYTKNKCGFRTHESLGINVDTAIYNAGSSMTSYTQVIPQHQTLPNYYRNNFNPVPSSFGACAFPFTNRYSTQPQFYNDFTKMNSFNSMTNNIRSPLQCLSHITAALENQQPCNSFNQSFSPKPQTYHMNNTNSSSEHCAECRHPLPLTALNVRDFVPHICPYCSAMYKSIECLDNHISTIHMIGMYKNPNFHNAPANGHSPWFCSSCRKYFCDHQTFIAHLQHCISNKHNIMRNMWYCDKCKNTFSTKSHFLQHSALCQISYQQQQSVVNEKFSMLKRNEIIESYNEHKEIYKPQNKHGNANQCNSLDYSFNPLVSNKSNTNCTKCKQISIACGKQKFCVSCFLKVKLNEDFEMIKGFKISLHLPPQSIVFKSIDSHIFQFNESHSTKLKCYFCGNCFNGISHFQSHLKSCNKFKNNPIPDLVIICCLCSRTFTTLISFQAHTFNCQNTQNCLLKTKASDYTMESHGGMEVNKNLPTETKLTQQSVIKTDIWECELCRKTFSNFLVFAIHVSSCKNSTQCSKTPDSLEASKQVSEKCSVPALINSSRSSLVVQKQECNLTYCVKCGHKFKDKSELQLHPCDEILEYMTSCFVQLEYLKFNKTLMRRLLSMYGYQNGWQTRRKSCLSYRQQYNEVFQNSKECNLSLKPRPKSDCQATAVHSIKGAIEENINDHDKFLAKLVYDSEKKFHQRGAHSPTEIYSQKFICSCGQVRPYLQASVHMKIHRNSKNHQIKFLKPLAKSACDKFQKLTHVFCKNCKQDFHDIDLFIGHVIFSGNCRKLYKTIARKYKFTKISKGESKILHNLGIPNIKLNPIKECERDYKNCSSKKSFHSVDTSSNDETKDFNSDNALSLKTNTSISVHAIEFVDKVANFIKTEMSSSPVTKQQSMPIDHISVNENLQLENPKSKASKRFTNSDGFMIDMGYSSAESVNDTASKYICANCYRSLYSKSALLDHLKQEHNIQGIIKLSVIKNQMSGDHTVQTINSVKDSVIKEHDFLINNATTKCIPWSPVITNTFSLDELNLGIWRK